MIFLGWVLYGIALVAPAVRVCTDETWIGFSCLLATVHPILWHFAVVNVGLLISPLVFWWGEGLEREAFGLFLLICASITLISLFCVQTVLIGCYLWMLSIFCTATGFLLSFVLSRRSVAARGNAPAAQG
jgi:hypothetical protein